MLIASVTPNLPTTQNPSLKNHIKLDEHPDVAAINTWFDKNLLLIECIGENEDDASAWNFQGPFLMLLTEDATYGKHLIKTFCELKNIIHHILPSDEDEALEMLEKLQTPLDGIHLLQIHHTSFFNESGNAVLKSSLQALMDEFQAARQVLIVCIANMYQFNDVDPALRSFNTFDKRILLNSRKPIDHAQDFLSAMPAAFVDQTIFEQLEKIGKLVEMDFPDKRRKDLYMHNLIRQACKHGGGTKVTFNDIVRQSVVGNTETYYPPLSEDDSELVALHESGHAAMMLLTSKGANTPQYMSIIESINHTGCVVEDIDYRYRLMRKPTYLDLLNRIRVGIAGRAAIESKYDLLNTYLAGDSGDLSRACQYARDLIAGYGLKVTSDQPVTNYELTLLRYEEGQADIEQLNQQVEMLINAEYKRVQNTLKENSALLEMLKAALLEKKELWQEDIRAIWYQYRNLQSLFEHIV